jgi:aarF domain-containing kinase
LYQVSDLLLSVLSRLQVNRDFRALASLYQRMGFIPSDVDTRPIIVALEDALPEVLNAR